MEDFSSLAPQRFIARELQGVAGRGQSAPLFVRCRSASGAQISVVLKLRDPRVPDHRPWNLCLVRDLVGAVIARRLGLNVPTYAIVEVDQSFIRATARHSSGPRIAANPGPNFGTVRLDAVSESIDGGVHDWAPVLAFDALGFNADRKGANPNTLWSGKALFVIDHGMLAPTWTFHIDGTTAASLYGPTNIHLHASFPVLKGKGAAYLEIASAWAERITLEFISWLRAQVPASWASAGEVDELFQFLGARAGIIVQQEAELRGVVR